MRSKWGELVRLLPHKNRSMSWKCGMLCLAIDNSSQMECKHQLTYVCIVYQTIFVLGSCQQCWLNSCVALVFLVCYIVTACQTTLQCCIMILVISIVLYLVILLVSLSAFKLQPITFTLLVKGTLKDLTWCHRGNWQTCWSQPSWWDPRPHRLTQGWESHAVHLDRLPQNCPQNYFKGKNECICVCLWIESDIWTTGMWWCLPRKWLCE